MAELDYDVINEIFDEIDDAQIEQIMNIVTPDNQAKILGSYLSEKQIADIEQSHMPSEPIQEPIPEKTEQQQ